MRRLTDAGFLDPVEVTCPRCGEKFSCDAQSKAAQERRCSDCLPPPTGPIPMVVFLDNCN